MTEQKQYLSVRNMKKYQHYKLDKPNWIKLYGSLWRECEFSQLDDATKAHVIGLFFLCSQHGNFAPFNKVWIAQELKASGPINWESILESGFIVVGDGPSRKNIDKSYLQKRRGEERREYKEEKNHDGEVKTISGFDQSKCTTTDKIDLPFEVELHLPVMV